MGTKHGKLMRGLEAAGKSDKTFDGIFGARFGRLFPKSHAAEFSDHSLTTLANAMISPFDAPKDSPDDEESGIPALYTYLGQFIDHDLTFDPDSSFQKQKDPNATEDFRTPAFGLNDTVLVPIFPLPAETAPGFPEGLTGFRRLISDWAIDWGRFIDIDVRDYGSADDAEAKKKEVIQQNFKRLQFAYRIDTALVTPLKTLPPSVAADPSSLALRNLQRGMEFGLPSGQAIAALLYLDEKDILPDDKILIGQGLDKPDPGSLNPITDIDKSFAGKCPLWTYILAEAIQHKTDVKIPVKQDLKISTPQLGPVGGSIVAEVFLGLMFADSHSYLSELNTEPGWAPDNGKDYRLKDFVEYALG